ncbi:putative RNA polymerase sigma-70 factor [Cystobacter fuscus DSM 2262]|uniref:RNA polymerase sigma-70 factor n=1 Tax=Cystobacter fuscus (strain ATCC 25194 / DSM 2262 / NBRC 100088 / M29) TaxID=1242864 RepID=S9P4C0_CYSF2|nr:sigma factor [Cystobacter fuscus]EPX57062.1 putative RNA polymerase sigma-70 factor [Cystobacter fuscus DSM 2262]
MSIPPPIEESELHARVLKRDNVASVDVYLFFAERIIKALLHDRVCDTETAHDAMVDAVVAYLKNPERYEPGKGSLITYLIKAARYKALDRRRSAAALQRGDQNYYDRRVEDPARSPKEKMEDFVEAKLLLKRFLESGRLKNEQEVEHLRLVLSGEGSTRLVAATLGLGRLPWEQLQQQVKRHRDRLMKLLERFGKEESNDPA